MRDDEHSEWDNSYILVAKKAPDSTPGMTNPSEITNLLAMNSKSETVASAEKCKRADVPAKRTRVCLDPRELNETLAREPYYTQLVDILANKVLWYTVLQHSQHEERILASWVAPRLWDVYSHVISKWQIFMDKTSNVTRSQHWWVPEEAWCSLQW